MNTDSALSKEAFETHDVLSCFDAIYVDASSWMSQEMESFLQQSAPYLRNNGKKLIMIAGVLKELENCAALKYAAQNALRLKEQYSDIIQPETDAPVGSTADGEFVRIFFFNHRRNPRRLHYGQQYTVG